MNVLGQSKLYLPGTSNKLNQLQFLSITDGGSNLFVGVNAGNKFPASYNTFLGYHAGEFSKRASTNVFVGAYAGQKSDRVSDIVSIGYAAGKTSTDNFSSVMIGTMAGSHLTRARYNTAVGHKSMAYSLSGSQNTAVGALAATNARGLANSVVVGYGAGANISGDFNVAVGALAGARTVSVASTLVGFGSGQNIRGNGVTTLGTSSLSDAVSAGDVVVAGAGAGRRANAVHSSVLIGAGVGEGIQHVDGSVVIGTRAGNAMTYSSNNVVIGDHTGVTMVNSTYNTIVGAQSAENSTSNYTTLVGSASMNRRDGNQVLFGNCVIVGENISFDTALGTETFTTDDAVRLVSTGVSITDPAHRTAFNPDGAYLQYVGAAAPGAGLATWTIEEAGAGVALVPAEREVTFSSAVLVSDGEYAWEWYAAADDALNIVSALYKVTASIETYDGLITMTTALFVESNGALVQVASKASQLAEPLITDDGANFWADIIVHQTPQTDASNGIEVTWSFSRNGGTYPSTESPVEPGAGIAPGDVLDLPDGTSAATGFAAGIYATTPPDSLTYGSFSARTDVAHSQKLAFVQLVYNTRLDSTYVLETRTTGSAHSVAGSGNVASVDQVTEGNPVFQLNLVDDGGALPHAGFTAASYDVGRGSIRLSAGANFLLPAAGRVGLEWLPLHPTTSAGVGDGYLAQLEFSGDDVAVSVYTRGYALFTCTGSSVQALDTVAIEGPGVPISLESARASDQTWAELSFQQQINQPLDGIVLRLTIRGFAADDTTLSAPESVRAYVFTVVDAGTPYDTQALSTVSVFADAQEGQSIARYFTASSVRSRATPEFHNSIYIGSNYLVDRGADASNAFVLCLGNNAVLMRGTAGRFGINSNLLHVSGSLLLGNSATQNYMCFGGTQGDGYENFAPSTYIGERLYEPDSERSELLVFKGEDQAGPLGPDRIRMVSHEFRVDMLVDPVVTPASFADAGNAGVLTVFTANAAASTFTGSLAVSGGFAVQGPATFQDATSLASLSVQDTLVVGGADLVAAIQALDGRVAAIEGADLVAAIQALGGRVAALEGADPTSAIQALSDRVAALEAGAP